MAELSDAEVFGSGSAPPASPRELSDAEVFGVPARDNPDFLFPTEYGPTPTDLPKPPAQPPSSPENAYPDLPFSEDYGQAVPPESARQIVGAMGEGWQATPSILTPEGQASQERLWGPYLGGGVNLLYRAANAPFAAGNALIYGGAELANQITGDPRAGRDFIMGAQVAPMARNGVIVRPGEAPSLPETPIHPLMDAFNRAEAERAAQPPRPQPPDPAVSGIARTHDQLGVGPDLDRPPPSPSGTPADRAPPGVPPGTEVPMSLRIKAAIDAADAQQPGPQPGFVPSADIDPITGQARPVQPPVDRVPPGAAGPPTVPYGPPTAPEPPMLMRDSPWPADAAQPAPAPRPEPPGLQPGPQSLGAAASRNMTDPAYLAAKTPAQALNDFRTSVMQTARDRANPGETPGTVEDHTVYVPGVQRLVSARVFDPEVAGNHDTMMDIDKAYETAATKQEQDNHDILKDTFLRQAGDTNSVAALEEQRDAVSPDALGVFQNERPVSAQPVVDTIQTIKDSPAWKVDAVRNVMQRVEKGLYDANGNLETMPSQLYGARQNLTTIRDSNALTQEASDAKAARYQLGQVLAPLDQVIGEGSNGYKDIYLPQWADYSRQIDQQRYLQSKTIGAGKVTGADGNLTANGMQKLLEQIAVDKGKRGNNAAKTLTDPQLDNLVAIRNELAAMQFRDQLAKSPGSPTVKKAAAAARLGNPVLNAARETAIHGVLAHTTGGAGNVVYQLGVKPVLEKRRERKAESIMTTTRNKLLSTAIPTD